MEVDEWLGGQVLTCDYCHQEKAEAQEYLDELEQDDFDDENLEERLEVEAKVKSITYSYRSYNPESMLLYAERYDWYVQSLDYIVLNKQTAISRLLALRVSRSCV